MLLDIEARVTRETWIFRLLFDVFNRYWLMKQILSDSAIEKVTCDSSTNTLLLKTLLIPSQSTLHSRNVDSKQRNFNCTIHCSCTTPTFATI